MGEYRNIDTHAPDYQPMAYYSSDADEADPPSGWPASAATGDARGRRPPTADHRRRGVSQLSAHRSGAGGAVATSTGAALPLTFGLRAARPAGHPQRQS